jgi:hypothetical protein
VHELWRFVELFGTRPQRIGAEVLGVLVLLGDRGQRRSGDAQLVLFEFGPEFAGQCLSEAAVRGVSGGADGAHWDLRTEDEDALAMPNAGHESVPALLLHAAVLVLAAKALGLHDESGSKAAAAV